MFKSNGVIELGVMLRGKGLHKPEFAFNIVRIHSLMIFTDLMEYNIVGYTMTPLLRCFFYFTTERWRQYNYRTFNNLQFRHLSKNFFKVITLT